MKTDNTQLIKQYQEGDSAALDTLICENLGLVRSIVCRFADRGVDFEDLMQIGTIGMIKAAKSFNLSLGCAFSTYAVPLIFGEIRRYLRDDGLIKVSREIKKTGIDIMKKKELFIKENAREPKISELAELCGISCEDVVFALEAITPVKSLFEPAGQSDDAGLTLEGMLCESENQIDRATDIIALQSAVAKLPPLQKKIVALRYYKELSQQQTGDILGISQVKVSREEKKIIEFLKNNM